ncbi:bifunctional DNA primase/polymerase [Streptomyces fuscigenes]|uniref:bifunctional DNA primase/polymerase n=1 Tax=Streptomyces fuscigenes TaxID=1528880 RepID=UPI0022A84C4A|nr:bifunctional DNA primase/polymerase [Streptomyces fuscigenes]
MTRRGVQWLSAGADDPEMCRARWADDPRQPYALATGRLFDVVVVNLRLGTEVFEQMERREMALGPVAVDRAAQQAGFFLPTNSRSRFERCLARETSTSPPYRYMEHGSFIVVPGPMPLATDRHQWLRAPIRRPETSPLRTACLAVMLAATAELIARADHYNEQYPSAAAMWAEENEETVDHAR